MKLPVVLLSLALGGALSGCAVKYGCPAPDGVTCKPISEVYSSKGGQSTPNDPNRSGTPGRPGVGDRERPKSFTDPRSPTPDPRLPAPDSAAVPIRSAPKVMRVWVAPWIDEEGDLHQEGYIYLVVNQGEWAVGLPSVGPEPKTGQLLKPEGRSPEPKLPGAEHGKE